MKHATKINATWKDYDPNLFARLAVRLCTMITLIYSHGLAGANFHLLFDRHDGAVPVYFTINVPGVCFFLSFFFFFNKGAKNHFDQDTV